PAARDERGRRLAHHRCGPETVEYPRREGRGLSARDPRRAASRGGGRSHQGGARPMKILEFRSDTFTKPTPAMRRAMAEAEVGDDQYGDGPPANTPEHSAAG